MKFPISHFSTTDVEKTSGEPLWFLEIDKIIYGLPELTDSNDLVLILQSLNIPFKHQFLDKYKYCISITDRGIHFVMNGHNQIYQIITNPFYFNNFKNYYLFLKKVLGLEFIDNLIVKQVDFCILISNIPFNLIDQKLNIRRKQTLKRIEINRKKHPTKHYGKRDNEIKFYSKSQKLMNSSKMKLRKKEIRKIQKLFKIKSRKKIPTHLISIEVSLKNKKLPSSNLRELHKEIQKKSFNPFSIVEFVNYSILSVENLPPQISIEKYYELVTTLKIQGFKETQKRFNHNKNFKRDFQKIAKLNNIQNIGDYYHPLLREYLTRYKK